MLLLPNFTGNQSPHTHTHEKKKKGKKQYLNHLEHDSSPKKNDYRYQEYNITEKKEKKKIT